MGADNISYMALYPSPVPAKNLREAKKFMAELKEFLEAWDPDGQPAEVFRKAESREGARNALNGFCLQKFPELSKESRERILNGLLECEDRSESPEFPEFDLDEGLPGDGYRDTAAREFKIGGKEYTVVCCGDMSWGDEPDGAGYQELKQAFRWGIVQLLGGQ